MATGIRANQAPQATSSKEYRPEVDGLRAFAVMAVLFFHAGFSWLGGGFVGVDVFFVISGYLITQIIVADCRRQKFSFASFLARRVARLYPALLVVLLACMLAGFVLFAAEHYRTLAVSTLGAFFSASNFVFWQSAGYFDTSSELNPLLHTWSLGVEQQFYLIWPILIYAAYRIRPSSIPYVLLGTVLVSLAASQWFTVAEPSANYFLTPFRVFEFGVGGLIPWLERYRPLKNGWLEGLLAAGFALLLYSALSFDKNTVFPGINAMVPVLGAALCIYAGRARVLGLLLRNKAVVFIGLMSYSLYLVHWPLIVFYKYYVYKPLGAWDKYLLVLAPFVLAYPLYRYVESKFRRVDLMHWNPLKAVAVALSVLFVLVPAAGVYGYNGLGFRVNDTYKARVNDPKATHDKQYGGSGYALDAMLGDLAASAPVAVVAGDSFALQYAAGLDYYLKEDHLKAQGVFQHGCIFGPDVTRLLNGQPRQDCVAKTQQMLAALEGNRLPLIFTMSWTGYADIVARPSGEKIDFKNDVEYRAFLIRNLQNILKTIPDRKVVIIGNQPGAGGAAGVMGCLGRPDYLPLKCLQALSIDETQGLGYAINQDLAAAFKDNANVLFFDPYDVLCKNGRCNAIQDGQILYSDTSHLSKEGSKVVSQVLVRRLKEFLPLSDRL